MSDHFLLAEALVWIAAIRMGLFLVPFHTLLVFLERASIQHHPSRLADRPRPGRIVWAIRAASRCVPAANSCLPRALSARLLLVRWGYPAQLLIGVAKNAEGELEAHAWVETGGQVMIGESQPGYFTPLAVCQAAER